MEGINNWLICWKFEDVIKLGASENTNEDKKITVITTITVRNLIQKYVQKITKEIKFWMLKNH